MARRETCDACLMGIEYAYGADRLLTKDDLKKYSFQAFLNLSDRRKGYGTIFNYCPICGVNQMSYWRSTRALIRAQMSEDTTNGGNDD